MDVLEEVYSFYDFFDGEKGIIGYSENGKPIPYFSTGGGEFSLIIQYCMHAREYITAYLALEHIKYYKNFDVGAKIYFLPVTNPDGVEIALYKDKLYKANAKGVDLNVNFDAKWGSGVYNKKTAGSSDYIGEYPFSAAESRCLRDFTYKIKPHMTISYHSKGEEIYFYFNQKENYERDKYIAEEVAKTTGYKIVNPIGSAGGYKDWCVEKLGIPALTIEVGRNELSHPVSKKYLPEIFAKNKYVPLAAVTALKNVTGEVNGKR